MAIYNYKYRFVKYETLEKFIRWFQNTLNLRDWEVYLEVGSNVPKEFASLGSNAEGGCWSLDENLAARVWINFGRCKVVDIHPLEVLSHELCHMLIAAVSPQRERMQVYGEAEDQLIYRIQGIILEKFCREYNLKLTKGEIRWVE